MITPLYLVHAPEGFFITCVNGGPEWEMMPISFWSETDEECMWDRWHGELTFGYHFYTCSYSVSAEAMRLSKLAVPHTIRLVARGIYRKVCEWRGQEPYPIIEQNHDRSYGEGVGGVFNSYRWPT